ncbi:sensor domain-containing diguanylate cyclase [Thermotoga profunda]|uniref:sensor domain-containing diguanylate cyclase n=1 Tax=Thermotoga profunda TaxID=1508420 RepID=UPI000596AEA7|nr:sensor domain-containing diguanylate cyclase [Thermotoga profunda]
MIRQVFLFIIVFAIVLTIFAFLNHQRFDHSIQLAKTAYLGKVEQTAKYISVMYFQRDSTLRLFFQNDTQQIEKLFTEIRQEFPEIRELKVLKVNQHTAEPYQIELIDENLAIKFNIYTENLNLYVPGKVILATLDSQEILNSLGVRNIKISKTGKDFTFGLKYQRISSDLDVFSFLNALLVSTIIMLYSIWNNTKTRFSVERILWKKSERERKALQIILDLTGKYLQGKIEQPYQTLLEKAIEIVPGAQSGTVLVKENERYKYVASFGYDLKELSKISFSTQEISQWTSGEFFIRTGLKQYDESNISSERLEILRKAGRIDEIKSTLIIPVRINSEITLLFNLDNFDKEDAFTSESVELAKLFANHLAMILHRINFERQLVQQQELMEYLSFHDTLTGLANRRMFEEFSEKIISLAKREGKKVSVLFMDLCKFKKINDEYGHHTGDEVLRIVGSRLEKLTRSSDLVSRFGGNEFVMILYDCSMTDAEHFVERVIKSIEEPIEISGMNFHISANIGIAEYPEDGENIDQLIRNADSAMYYAKKQNLVCAKISECQDN